MMIRLVLFWAALCAVAGCGSHDATVQGTVTVDGQLARRGTVQFHPTEGGPAAYGSIADNGTYSLRVGQGDLSKLDSGGVESGEYIVTVSVDMPPTRDAGVSPSEPPTPGARLSAERYSSKETSDLRATVKVGPNVIPLELESEPPDTEESSDEAEAKSDGQDRDQQDSALPPEESTEQAEPAPPGEGQQPTTTESADSSAPAQPTTADEEQGP